MTVTVSTDKAFLTVKDVTSLLGVSPNTVYRWINSGQLGAVDLGNVAGKRTTPALLSQFLNSRVKVA